MDCKDCLWKTQAGRCAPTGLPAVEACAMKETKLDCKECSACCRESFTAVNVRSQDAVAISPSLIELRHGKLVLRREGLNCAAWDPASHLCTIYENRPDACRQFEMGSVDCLRARQAVGLTSKTP